MKILYFPLLTTLMLLVLSGCSVNPLSGKAVISENAAHEGERIVRYRKNIDELTADELAAYRHAIRMMKKKSEDNVYDRTGFLWQAWVHNCPSVKVNESRQLEKSAWYDGNCHINPNEWHREHPGMCEHAKDTFFQWHRAEFYFFEKALQAADPDGIFGPSTRNVTVPFWNFTKAPSGDRYPKAFEDQFIDNKHNPLYADGRIQGDPATSICVDDGQDNQLPCSAITSPYLLASLIYNDDWPTFGGYPASGEGNYGSFEAQIHNPMHDKYVGGYLASPTTAGLDPLFFSFHAFIDYIYEKWLQEHGTETVTSSRYFLRGEQDGDLLKPVGFTEGTGTKRPGNFTKNMGRGEIYFNTRQQGYAYQPAPDGEFLPRETLEKIEAEYQTPGQGFADNPVSYYSRLLSFGSFKPDRNPGDILTNNFTLPEQTSDQTKAVVKITRMSTEREYSFEADVYIHPAKVKPDVKDPDFRNRYLATIANYWQLNDGGHSHPGHHQQGYVELSQRIDRVINSLIHSDRRGEEWSVSVAVKGTGYSGPYDFAEPEVIFQPLEAGAHHYD